MNKLLFVFAFCMMFASAFGAKVITRPSLKKQSDGSTLTVYWHGDEHFTWYATRDGVILFPENGSFYIARTTEEGGLENTMQLAHEPSQRTKAEQDLCAKQDREGFLSRIYSKAMAKGVRNSTTAVPDYFPHMGTPKIPVILAQFKDKKFKNDDEVTVKTFDAYLNKEKGAAWPTSGIDKSVKYNKTSVREYYDICSFGKFKPQFDVYGPVTLDHDFSYYYVTSGTHESSEFIPHVLSKADSEVDFSQYDSDGDGYVDMFIILFAGYSTTYQENVDDKNGFHPHVSYGNYGTRDGKRLYRYGLSNELNYYYEEGETDIIDGIGIFVHEFGHGLGYPDLYPTNFTRNNQGMEYWSLMDAGEHNNDRYTPTLLTAWERNHMGWMDIETLTEPGEYVLPAIDNYSLAESDAKAYKIVNDQCAEGETEYYILQNVQNNGVNNWLKKNGFNQAKGLMITHVEGTDFSLFSNPNNTSGHPRMTVLPADGLLLYSGSAPKKGEEATPENDSYVSMPGDVFPGTGGVTSFDFSLSGYPNSIVYYGAQSVMAKKDISDIYEDENGNIHFTYRKGDIPSGIKGVNSFCRDNGRVYNLSGQQVSKNYRGITIVNGKKYLKK